MLALRCFVVLVPLGVVFGCGSSGVVYSGHTHPSIARASQLRELDTLPDGYDRIGKVSARCTLTEGVRPKNGSTLADVDCSEARLRTAIRERAAEVGGEVLVDLRCHSRVRNETQHAVTLGVSCRGGVARPSDESLAHRPLLSDVLGDDAVARAGEAWRIRVSFTPRTGAPERPQRGSDSVRELPLMPVNDVRLGDITTSCECGCTEEGARTGLLAAAGRMGASDVVGLGCVAKGRGFFCSATAAAFEVDPEMNPRAR